MKSREQMAEEFVELANVFAMGTWKPFVQDHPHLWQAIKEAGRGELTFEQKVFKWDFLLMVAMAWWSVNAARLKFPKSEFEKVADIIERHIAEWNRGTVPAYADLNQFVCRYKTEYVKISDPDRLVGFMKLLVGTWLLWNLTDKTKFKDEAQLATTLGAVAHECGAGYWYQGQATSE